MRKRILKSISILLSAIVLCVLFSGCFWIPSILDDEVQIALVGDAKMSYAYDEEYGLYNVIIEGIAKNQEDVDLESANVSFVIYDADGNGIGYAEDYINYVEANGTWRFCARAAINYEPSTFRLQGVYGCDWE